MWYDFGMKYRALCFTVVGLIGALILRIAVPVILTSLGLGGQPDAVVGVVHLTVVGLLFLVLVVEIVSAFKIDDSTFHTAFISGGLFIMYLFSADAQVYFADRGVALSPNVCGCVSELAFVVAALGCCQYILYLYGFPMRGKTALVLYGPVAPFLILYFVLQFFGYAYIVHFGIVLFIISSILTIMYRAETKNKIGFTTYFTAALCFLSVGAQSANALFYDGCTAALPGILLAFAALSFSMYIPTYLMFAIHSDNKAVKSAEYKERAEFFETKALSGQIKPHFIFNSLEAIRTLYHRDLAEGDAALSYLSDFLRDSIYSFDSVLVPFETEIDNVFNYTEFENFKRDEKIDVLFNIDFTDFRVPPFSVQPFVENALKYSGVDKIENGCIVISSYKRGGSAVVEISDNGRGFDLSKVKESSHGIKNACERFALILGAEPEITSEIGAGTRIRIVIDLKGEGGKV